MRDRYYYNSPHGGSAPPGSGGPPDHFRNHGAVMPPHGQRHHNQQYTNNFPTNRQNHSSPPRDSRFPPSSSSPPHHRYRRDVPPQHHHRGRDYVMRDESSPPHHRYRSNRRRHRHHHRGNHNYRSSSESVSPPRRARDDRHMRQRSQIAPNSKLSPPRVTRDQIMAMDKKRNPKRSPQKSSKKAVPPPLSLSDVSRLQQGLEKADRKVKTNTDSNPPQMKSVQEQKSKGSKSSSHPIHDKDKDPVPHTKAEPQDQKATLSQPYCQESEAKTLEQPPTKSTAQRQSKASPQPIHKPIQAEQKSNSSASPQPPGVNREPKSLLDLIRDYLTTAQKDTVTFPSNSRMYVVQADSENDIHKSIKYGVWSCTDPILNEQLGEDFSRGLPTFLLFRCKGTSIFYGIALIISQFHSEYYFPLFDRQRRGAFYIEWKLVKDIPVVNFRNMCAYRSGMRFYLDTAGEGCHIGGPDMHDILKTWKAVKSTIGRFPSLFDVWDEFDRAEPQIWLSRSIQPESVPGKQFSYIPLDLLKTEPETPIIVQKNGGTLRKMEEHRGNNYFTDSDYRLSSDGMIDNDAPQKATASPASGSDDTLMIDSESDNDSKPAKRPQSSGSDDMSDNESSSDGSTADVTILKSAFKAFPKSSLFSGCTFVVDSVFVQNFMKIVLKAHGANVVSAPRDSRGWSKVTHFITTQEHFDENAGIIAQAKKKKITFVSIRWIITTLTGKVKIDSKFFHIKNAGSELTEEHDDDDDDDVYDLDLSDNLPALRKNFGAILDKIIRAGKTKGVSDTKFYTFIRTEDKDAAQFIKATVKEHESLNATKTYRLKTKLGKDFASIQWNRKSGRVKMISLLKKWASQSGFQVDLSKVDKNARDALKSKLSVSKSENLTQEQSKLTKPPFKKIRKNTYIGKARDVLLSKEKEVHQCHCLPHILMKQEYDPARGDDHCGDMCENRLSNFECTIQDTKHGLCENKRFQKKKWIKSAVKATPMKGWGLFSQQDVEEEDFIMEYVGEIIDDEELEARKVQYAKEGRPHYYFISLEGNMTIDATQKGCDARFINHSCDPNCETQKWTIGRESVIGIFALKDIQKGEELTFDYGFERFGGVGQKCYCGSENCRGVIQAKKKDKKAAKLSRRKNLKNNFAQLVERVLGKDSPSRSDYKKGKKNDNPVFMWRNMKRGFARVERQIEAFEEQLTVEQRQEEQEKEEIEKLQHSLQITPIQARVLYRQMKDDETKRNAAAAKKKTTPKKSTLNTKKSAKTTSKTVVISSSESESLEDDEQNDDHEEENTVEEEQEEVKVKKDIKKPQRTRRAKTPVEIEQKPKSVSSRSSAGRKSRHNVIASSEEDEPMPTSKSAKLEEVSKSSEKTKEQSGKSKKRKRIALTHSERSVRQRTT
eukprot:CAMPEP_0117443380 /NCGR_PEP_ID=MMETSP0759-20121206/4665_1 /TAXON_ID=63605 /ORGANISM="Percolomonas cosmopolitus, Strain WS" /LENGTH=1387 /DNA_ID=CAMNT_0005235353 /DNA_START=283 /DNA_END=4446 /DNA_ORIENTATION=-